MTVETLFALVIFFVCIVICLGIYIYRALRNLHEEINDKFSWRAALHNELKVEYLNLKEDLSLLVDYLNVHIVDRRERCVVKKGGPEKGK